MAGPAALVVPAIKRHTATVIVAHGLGDSGVGWIWLAENWRKRNKFEEVKFVFPNAPSIPITLNMGMRMPGWYDIVSLSAISQGEDETGITRSQTYFHGLINDEIAAGIPSNRIVLGGFSQGGAMSLFAGLTFPQKLGGIFGLSSYMLLQGSLKDKIAESGNANGDTKIFMGHGDADQVVKYEWGNLTADKLKAWGHDVDFKTYPGLPHSADPEEIDDLEAYLRTAIPPLEQKETGEASALSSLFGGTAPSTGVLRSLSGISPQKASTRSRAAVITAVSPISDLMRALQGFKHLDLDPAMKAALQEQGAGAATASDYGSYFLPMMYDGPQPSEDALGKKLNALPLRTELWTMLNYKDIVSVTNTALDYMKMRTTFRTKTLPLRPENPKWFGEVQDIFANISTTYAKKMTGLGALQLILQPFPRSFGMWSNAKGGNAMGFSVEDHDRLVLEIPGVYTSKADDQTMQAWSKAFTDAVLERIKTATAATKATYNPFFMNDAGPDQNVMSTYRESKKFAALQKELDPQGLFSKRVGGYKYIA